MFMFVFGAEALLASTLDRYFPSNDPPPRRWTLTSRTPPSSPISQPSPPPSSSYWGPGMPSSYPPSGSTTCGRSLRPSPLTSSPRARSNSPPRTPF
eukprot:986007-Prorocentrum_minimum.AAC.1